MDLGRYYNGSGQRLATEAFVDNKTQNGGYSMVPNYSARKSISINTNYTATSNGYVMFYGTYSGGDHWAAPTIRIYVNGFQVAQDSSFRHTSGFGIYIGATALVRKGDTYNAAVSLPQGGWFTSSSQQAFFIPAT